jgi:hypothetical protein
VSWDQRVCQSCGAANAANRDACFACGKTFVSDAVSAASTLLAGPQGSLVAGVIEGDYLVVPFIGRINTGFFSSENAGTVSRQLQSLINSHSQQGWEFQSLAKVGVEVAPGCLASLFGAKTSYITFDQAIFRRARS